MPMLVVVFFYLPPAKRACMVMLGVRIEGVWECCQPVFSSKYAIVHSMKLVDMLNRWQGWCVPSYFYQNGESFMLAPAAFSEILKVISCSVENLSCTEKRKCHSLVLMGVIIRCSRSVIENINTSTEQWSPNLPATLDESSAAGSVLGGFFPC